MSTITELGKLKQSQPARSPSVQCPFELPRQLLWVHRGFKTSQLPVIHVSYGQAGRAYFVLQVRATGLTVAAFLRSNRALVILVPFTLLVTTIWGVFALGACLLTWTALIRGLLTPSVLASTLWTFIVLIIRAILAWVWRSWWLTTIWVSLYKSVIHGNKITYRWYEACRWWRERYDRNYRYKISTTQMLVHHFNIRSFNGAGPHEATNLPVVLAGSGPVMIGKAVGSGRGPVI